MPNIKSLFIILEINSIFSFGELKFFEAKYKIVIYHFGN